MGIRILKVSVRNTDKATIVDLEGAIDLGNSPGLRATLFESLLNTPRLALNMTAVRYIDSSGIGELVSAFTTVKGQGGELKLLNLTKKVHDLLQITKLYTVFDVKDNEAAAIKSFN